MDTLTARPRLLKQANLSQIRRVIKRRGTATRAEIAGETQISSTTVRSLLAEMMENGEIAAVIIDDEATLKRVYYDREHARLQLVPENPAYSPLVYVGEELDNIRILGKAVGFMSIF